VPAEPLVIGECDITGCKDVLIGRPAIGVHDDAAAAFKTRLSGQLVVGQEPDPRDHNVSREDASSIEDDAEASGMTFDLLNAAIQEHLSTLLRIPPGRGRDSTLMAGGIPADRGQQSRPSRAAFQTMAGRTPF